MPSQKVQDLLAIIRLRKRSLHFKMFTPTAQLQALIAPFFCFVREVIQTYIGPSAAKERYVPTHRGLLKIRKPGGGPTWSVMVCNMAPLLELLSIMNFQEECW